MKITKIEVTKLFGIFNHKIPLNNNGITIIIGENGLGKTVILESINAFFGKDYDFFRELEFEKISFYFDTEEFWEITKRNTNKQIGLFIAKGNTGKPITKPEKITDLEIKNKISSSKKLTHQELDKFYKFQEIQKELIYDDLVLDSISNRVSKARLMRQYELLNQQHFFDVEFPALTWLAEDSKKINIKFIETQRLITAKVRGGEAYVNTVPRSSDEIIEEISDIEKRASNIAIQLDSTYPNRLVQKLKQDSADTFAQLNAALQKLDERRKLLSSLGVIIETQDSDLFQIKKSESNLIGVLKLYIDDSNQKLAPYDEIAGKIKLFTNIINKRFKHKTLEIKKSKGFIFKSKIKKDNKGEFQEISPMKLSSGEKNELILFYELIFKSKPGDMILIDEPELSLHISWQNKFINDLKDVTSMNKVSIVIATHSPDIIDENWELRVELEGVE